LGKLCQKRRELELAFGCFKKAFELAPDDEKNVDLFYFTGASLGRWEEMYDPLATFCHQNPQHAMGLARLSAVCFNLQSDALAEDTAGRCLALDPNNAIAKSILARTKERAAKIAENGLKPEAVLDLGGLRLDLNAAPLAW
jgi:tetratricopeptide (TPR) repeat protein